MQDLEKLTAEVAKLTRAVGQFIKTEAQAFDRGRVELKGKSDLVSYVDKGAEEQLVSGLRELLPEAGFLTEENTVEQTKATYRWVIDPLDGTTNFVHGVPMFAVSVGLQQGEEVVVGVIYEVNRDEAFYAWQGGGAYLNGKPIRVSAASKISEGLFATGFPVYNFSKLKEYLEILNHLMEDSHGLRRLGSAATDMAYVACGRCEAFFEYNLHPWDVAAGAILVKEAGGTVTDFSGSGAFLEARELVAGGPVHTELLKVIQKYWTGLREE
ncbi:MAG: inositol monophosphatase family protein [Bacteroidota bacterium]